MGNEMSQAYQSEDDGEEKSEMELIRDQNLKIRRQFVEDKLKNDPEFGNYFSHLKPTNNKRQLPPPDVVKATKKPKLDPTFRFSGAIPKEKRRSSRLQNVKPEFSYTDLPNETQMLFRTQQNADINNLEDIVYKPKKRQRGHLSAHARSPSTIIPVEEVTQEMLEKIAVCTSQKVLSSSLGTSCHQCRQKTLDTKTCCRNKNCFGVRGQLCGPCIRNRYGEDAAVALLDPDWICFACRGTCNCSFCRLNAGKQPTGILAPTAQKKGFNSVHQYLESLKSEVKKIDPECLLGFKGSVPILAGMRQNAPVQDAEVHNGNKKNNSDNDKSENIPNKPVGKADCVGDKKKKFVKANRQIRNRGKADISNDGPVTDGDSDSEPTVIKISSSLFGKPKKNKK